MTRFLLAFGLLASSVFTAQAQVPASQGTPIGPLEAIDAPDSPADPAKTATGITITVDYANAGRRPIGAPASENRPPFANSNIVNNIWVGAEDTAGQNSFRIDRLAQVYGPDWYTFDQTMFSRPSMYTVERCTVNVRSVYNRTDEQPDSLILRIHPLSSELLPYQSEFYTQPDYSITLDSVVIAIDAPGTGGTEGSDSYNEIIDSIGPGGGYQYWISGLNRIATFNYDMNHMNVQQLHPTTDSTGFAISVEWRAFNRDTAQFLVYGHHPYVTTNPVTVNTNVIDTTDFFKTRNFTSLVQTDIVNAVSDTTNDFLFSTYVSREPMTTTWTTRIFIDTGAVVGVNEALAGSLTVGNPYPNPTTNAASAVLPFSTRDAQQVNVEVVSTLGQVVYTYSNKAFAGQHNLVIPTEGLTPGLYFVRVNSAGGNAVRRIVVN
jgi:hypothetical protein